MSYTPRTPREVSEDSDLEYINDTFETETPRLNYEPILENKEVLKKKLQTVETVFENFKKSRKLSKIRAPTGFFFNPFNFNHRKIAVHIEHSETTETSIAKPCSFWDPNLVIKHAN